MLYLDYSRKPGEWVPNAYGGNENLDAIAFLRRTTANVAAEQPGTGCIAEESTAWPGVSRATDEGSLGFAYRSEEHTSELQSLMRISYAVFCLKKKHRSKAAAKHTTTMMT